MRTNVEIIFQILTVCQEGASKAKIVIRANLNYKSAKPYIDMLASSDLIKLEKESSNVYTTTEKGIRLMYRLRSIGCLLK